MKDFLLNHSFTQLTSQSKMLESLNQLDTSVFLFFNGMHAPFFDRFMMLFTGRFLWVPMYAALLFVIIRACGNKSAFIYLLAIAATITLTDQTCASLIRPIVERLRPSNPENPLSALTFVVDDYRGGSYGFPSCHSANSFALAAFMAMLIANRGFRVFIFGWAIFNSYTRLYLGVHYPGDLLTGAIVGGIYGVIFYYIARIVDSRMVRKGMPTAAWRSVAMSSLNRPVFSIIIPPLSSFSGHAPRRYAISAMHILFSVVAATLLFILTSSVI